MFSLLCSAEDKKGITFKWMPKRPLKVLRGTLERLYSQICMDMSSSPTSAATTAADNTIDCTDSEAEAIDLDFVKHRKEVRIIMNLMFVQGGISQWCSRAHTGEKGKWHTSRCTTRDMMGTLHYIH